MVFIPARSGCDRKRNQIKEKPSVRKIGLNGNPNTFD